MSDPRIEQLRRIQDRPAIIVDKGMRSQLKRLGLVEAAPQYRDYRAMPYQITDKGRRELAAHDALKEKQ